MSPRRLPDDRPTPPRPAGRSRQYRQEDAVAGSHHERSPRRRLPVPREVSPRRDDASPRRAQLARRPSVDPPSPRGSPRRGTTHSNATTRRASTEPQRRASLLPRSASQETEGSTVAPSDVVLPDLEPEVGEDSVTTPESGQVIHLPHEGQKGAERVGTARGSTRGRGGGKDQMNLPVVTHLGRRRSFEYPASPETMRHRLGVAGVKSPSGRGAGGNNSNSAMPREGDRLSPCVNSAQRTLSATRSGDCDYRNSAQQNASSHSATSSVSRHNGGGGGGVRAPMIHHADDQTAVRSDQPAGGGRAEWRSARPARSAYPHSTPHTDATRAAAADAISVPRKLVIDVNQYDRYARATGRIRTIASGDEPVYIGGHRRLINLMYPAQTQLQQHHRKPGHIVPRKSPQLPRTPMQQSHGVQHHLLGVTGERAVGSGRGIVRDTLPSGQLPVRHGEAVSQHLTEMPRDLRATSPVSCARSRTPSPAYFKSPAQTQKVELPAISPTPVSGANAKLHIEDLDK